MRGAWSCESERRAFYDLSSDHIQVISTDPNRLPIHPPNQFSLDLGITRIDGAQKYELKYKFSKAGFVSIEDHAKW